jgi:acetyl esterase/lipase
MAFRRLTLLLALLMALAAFAQQPPAPQLPKGTVVHRDLAYVTKNAHERHVLDLYLPAEGDNLPLIIWIHGGGWQNGSKERPTGLPFLREGYALASINYRLSGHALFPAQIEDCKAAVRWLRANARKYRIDPNRFGVWGASAGGHLVAMLGTTGGVKEFDVGENLQVSSRVQAVCDFYGPTDFLQMDAHRVPGAALAHDSPGSPEARLVGGPIQENKEKVARANPITYIRKDAPPFLIVHGDADPLVPHHQSELLRDALEKAGVPVSLYTVKGGGHGQGFQQDANLMPAVRAFFAKTLRPRP